jgi:tRNA-2-methylthio-N6-dimethylallyladenosine synthase
MALKQLPEALRKASAGESRVIDTTEYPDNHLFPIGTTLRRSTAKALVTITEGCDHGCTYCIVPAVRGPERHRPCEEILCEVRHLAEIGYREIELLGQNVNSYAGGCTFAELLAKVGEVPDIEWIRFTTSHPMNFTRELAREIVENPQGAPFLHLPHQSGSDKILRRMRREYSFGQYLERVGYLREGRERIALSTDFIVGFPGETDEDFEATMSALEEVHFDASFSFIYSPRPGTPALRYQDDLPPEIKSSRLARLQARQKELTFEAHRRFVGRTLPVRIESMEPVEQGHWLARTGEWVNVHLTAKPDSPPAFGHLVNARIVEAGPHFLRAEAI